MVPEGESMAIMVGSMAAGRQAGRHGNEAVGESLHLSTSMRQNKLTGNGVGGI